MEKVIFLGKGKLGIRVAEWFLNSPDYELIAVVPVIPEPAWAPSLQNWAESKGVTIIRSGHYKDIEGVKEPGWNIDLCFSVFYDKIIKDWYIQKCRRILNLHNGPLPKYRGVSPINWALKNGEIEHGITIHEITPGIDDGPIVSQVKYSIYPEFDEVVDAYERSLEFGWTLFEQTMPLLKKIRAREQEHSQATYYDSGKNPLLGDRRYFRKADSAPVKA